MVCFHATHNKSSIYLLARPKKSVPIRYLEPPVCLTSVERVPSSLNVGCVTLKSLIGDVSYPSGPDIANLGDILYNADYTSSPYSQQHDLELMVQINFMIDVPFVMNHVHESIREGLKTIVYHGLRLSMNEVMVRIYADADWLHV